MRWTDLSPEPGIVAAIQYANSEIAATDESKQDDKRHWSECFANQCAVAFADEFRKSSELRGKIVKPVDLKSGTEPLTPLGSAASKRIDVTIADRILGLEIGVSLKGFNFADRASGYFDKNLTGRLYELADEVRLVHEHLPHAFMAGVLFLPLGSTEDKKSNSSFSNAVVKLRARTGRLDAALIAHASRCDAAFVGLYTTGREAGGYPQGIVRFLDVASDPPQRGRPKVDSTLSFSEVVQTIVERATLQDTASWSEPESDS